MNANPPMSRIAYAERVVRRFAEDVEVWVRDGAGRGEFGPTDLIDDVNRQFERILDIDAATRERYAGGAAFDPEIERAVHDLMCAWVRTARGIRDEWDRSAPAADHPGLMTLLRANLVEAEAMTATGWETK